MNSILKAINLTRFDGISVNLSDQCMSYTEFYPEQVLQVELYNNMIIIKPAITEHDELN